MSSKVCIERHTAQAVARALDRAIQLLVGRAYHRLHAFGACIHEDMRKLGHAVLLDHVDVLLVGHVDRLVLDLVISRED